MREVGVVLDTLCRPVYWHVPGDRTVVRLPDSRTLWDVIWENRANLLGIAHSHPGSGPPGPSYEDATTFAGIEAALGRRLTWYITSSRQLAVVSWVGPDRLSYLSMAASPYGHDAWLPELRRLSGYEPDLLVGVTKAEEALLVQDVLSAVGPEVRSQATERGDT